MGRTALAHGLKLLEAGSISFLYRPPSDEPHAPELNDIQRVLMLLSPAGAVYERVIAVGRKALPPPAHHERFWGFVDLVLAPYDMQMALGAQVYGTKTRGVRHLPAARAFASGSYDLASHGGQTHLRWHVDHHQEDDPAGPPIPIEIDGDYLVTVANPDPGAWGVLEPPDIQTELFDELEVHVPLPSPFPPSLQQRFRNRRFIELDSPAWLDHPGAELVFLGAASD